MRTGKVARIADRVRKELGELTPQERDLAVKALRAALYEGFALDAATSDPNQMEACVRCGSIRIIRKGRGRDGSQRWKCMNCNRTFGVRTNRVMGMSKLKAGVWMRFLECFVDCLSLRKCAQRWVVPEKLRTLDHGRPWSDDQFASTRLSSNRDMSR